MKLPEPLLPRLAPSHEGTGRERTGVGAAVRTRIVVLLIVLLVVVTGGIAIGVVASGAGSAASVPAGVDGEGGIPVASGRGETTAVTTTPMALTIYTDYSSNDAATFLTVNDLFMRGLLDAGTATIAIHPVALPELSSGDGEYALRAANAAACVAEYASDSFWEFHVALFANQPTGPVSSASDDDLVELAAGSGVGRMGEVGACIREGTFAPWVQDRSADAAVAGGVVDRIPVVVADGRVYEGSISSNTEFRAFLASVSTVS